MRGTSKWVLSRSIPRCSNIRGMIRLHSGWWMKAGLSFCRIDAKSSTEWWYCAIVGSSPGKASSIIPRASSTSAIECSFGE